MNIWAIVLALGAGLGLVAEDAFADRPRHGSSATHQHRHSHQPRQHHVQPRHHHRHFSPPRIVVAPSYFPRRHYYVPAPVYVAPPVIAVPQAVPPMNSGYWYFCPDSRAYYPNVLECPSGWLAVVPGAGGPPN